MTTGASPPSPSIDAGLAELSATGWTIVQSALPTNMIHAIRDAVADERRHLAAQDPVGLSKTSPALGSKAHLGFLCPLQHPFVAPGLLAPTHVAAITERYLGGQLYLHEMVVNIALGGSTTSQVPHPDQEPEALRVGVVWNVALVKTGPANGMTCLHSGTHLDGVDHDGAPRVQPTLHPGDILIRDLALVHHGMPNRASKDRPLLAVVVKPNRQTLPAHMVSLIPRTAADELPEATRFMLRRHQIVDATVVHARPYPIPHRLPDHH